MADNISVSVENRLLTPRMDRPEKKNALTRAMYLGMIEGLRQAEADAAVRVIVITGAQGCFTAGNDLVDFANAKPGEPAVALQYLEALTGMQKPVEADAAVRVIVITGAQGCFTAGND